MLDNTILSVINSTHVKETDVQKQNYIKLLITAICVQINHFISSYFDFVAMGKTSITSSRGVSNRNPRASAI
jgi:hypothetical protein